jgi:hypothetical protein
MKAALHLSQNPLPSLFNVLSGRIGLADAKAQCELPCPKTFSPGTVNPATENPKKLNNMLFA